MAIGANKCLLTLIYGGFSTLVYFNLSLKYSIPTLLFVLFVLIVILYANGDIAFKELLVPLCLPLLILICVSAVVFSSIWIYCTWNECCTSTWITSNLTGLAFALNQNLYGQHLVIGPTVKHLRGHVETHPKRPLVLSFHGVPGTGKNFVSSMIAEHMYAKGMSSQYVHYFSATKDFIHEDRLEEYQLTIKQHIVAAVQACPQSLFIFDEMDKMPSGIMDVVKPYLEYNQPVDGTDYRHSVFLFLR
ncbi:torsin-1B-like [Mya arenaria]|nr:torsin-1B-like [Mya arenaria]